MNQLIRLLVERAGIHDDVCSMCPIHELEKFAELIINECIDQVAGTKIVAQLSGDEITGLSESSDKKYAQWNNALAIATMNIRDHFGLEK